MNYCKAKYVAIEGMDGAGKSTQVSMLARRLDSIAIPHIYTREAGSTPQGQAIRDILLNHDYSKDLDPFTQACLFAASYREGITKRILPALEAGQWVISDRTNLSAIVYQNALSVFPESVILNNELVSPDVIFILDVDHASFMKRQQDKHKDYKEHELADSAKFNALRKRYLDYASKHTHVVLIDAMESESQIHAVICNYLKI